MKGKIYLDTNILLDYLIDDNAKRPNRENTLKFLEKKLEEDKLFVVNNYTILNSFFVMSHKKEYNVKTATTLLEDIEREKNIWQVVNDSESIRLEAYKICKEKDMDLEDLCQYLCAKKSGCEEIITNDKGFPKLDMPLIRTQKSIKSYIPK